MHIKVNGNRLFFNDKSIPVSCNQRKDRNIGSDLIVLSIPENKPVMPISFPKGNWHIFAPRERTDPYLAPFFIPTDAFAMLPIWELDENNCYKKATMNFVKDTGYGLHFSTSSTTQGCIKIERKQDLLELVQAINKALAINEECTIEVM